VNIGTQIPVYGDRCNVILYTYIQGQTVIRRGEEKLAVWGKVFICVSRRRGVVFQQKRNAQRGDVAKIIPRNRSRVAQRECHPEKG